MLRPDTDADAATDGAAADSTDDNAHAGNTGQPAPWKRRFLKRFGNLLPGGLDCPVERAPCTAAPGKAGAGKAMALTALTEIEDPPACKHRRTRQKGSGFEECPDCGERWTFGSRVWT